MAYIRPFKALRYNTNLVKGEDVTAPPYDIVSDEHRETLYSKSPYNIIRIDFGKDAEHGDRYQTARHLLHQWIKDGILVRDTEDSLYQYDIEYKVDNKNMKLSGILCLLKLTELGKGVYPHEATHSKPKTDRLNLMKACLSNISPIFVLYRGDSITPPERDSVDFQSTDSNGAIHKLVRHTDKEYINGLVQSLKDRGVFIADGHHRYEVALEFKNLAEAGLLGDMPKPQDYIPWEYVLVYLVNINASEITILPTHRLIKSLPINGEITNLLSEHFQIQRIAYDGEPDHVKRTLAEAGQNALGIYTGGKDWLLLRYKNNALYDLPQELRSIDTVILQELILKRDLKTEEITYEMDLKKALKLTEQAEYKAVFILNPTKIEEVEQVALKNLRMPPKSTYFYPKLLTGMAIHTFF